MPEIQVRSTVDRYIVSPRKAKANRNRTIALAFGAVAVAILGTAWLAFYTSSAERRSADQNKAAFRQEVIEAAKDAILADLVSPGSAKFSRVRITDQTGTTYTVAGVVDSQNRMGGLLHTEWEVKIWHHGKRREVDITRFDTR